MVLIWRGRGWVVAVLTFALMVGIDKLAQNLTGDPEAYSQGLWPLPLALALGGLLSYVLGRRWNAGGTNESAWTLFDSKAPHTLFTLRLETFGVLLGIGAVVLLAYRTFSAS